jgi:arylsulfatase A-like enzyme/Flp pilus assembly protein TadD
MFPVRCPGPTLRCALGWIGLCLAAAASLLPAAIPPRPANVLLVTIDTLRADHIGAYGYGRVETPNIDRLARRGVLFAEAVSPVPLTLPAHAAIMTGTNPPANGARNNGQRLGPAPATLAAILKGKGYRTGAFVGAFPLDSRFGLDRGFETYDDHYGSRNASRDMTFVERKADDVNRPAAAWISARRGEPFFAWVHYFDPHAPYEPPPPYAAGYRGREYDGEIAYADAALGRLLAELEKSGLMENTLIVLTADHGESLGEHGEATHGIFVYDASLRVPLILAHPTLVPAGRTVRSPVGLADLAPTILDLLGFSVPAGMEGVSAAQVLKGGPGSAGPKLESREIYIECLAGWMDRRWAPLRGIRTEAWKYIEAPQAELYDLKADPGETKNILSAHPDEARRMGEALDRIVRAAPAATAASEPMSAETRQKLRSLGYLGADAVPVSVKPPDPKTMLAVDSLFNDAVLASEAGRLVAAAAQFAAILDRHPEFVQAYEYAAYNLYKMGRIDDAIALLRKALTLDFRTAPLLSRLGLYLQETGRTEESIAVLEQAAGLGPDDAEVHNDLGVSLFKNGAAARAIREFQRSIELDRSNAMAYNNLGNAHLGLESYDEAGAAYAQAVAYDPKLASPYNGLGAVAYRRGEMQKAVGFWEQAIAIEPRLPDTLYNLGRAYLRLDRKKDALRCFEDFVRFAPARNYAKDIAEVKSVIERLKKEIGGDAHA